MSANWTFIKPPPGSRLRDPIQGEFFATEAIKDASEALIREGIQNALDATPTDDGVRQTRVRITVARGKRAAKANDLHRFFTGAWPHLHTKGNGLQEPPAKTDDCPYLLFEDFGTTGLTGDERQSNDIGEPNPFFFFFRAENRSAETGGTRGRWGVGKQVFPRASRTNLIFGLTVRHDDKRRLLMGSAVLKSHRIENEFYMPDGFFGHLEENGVVVPVSDAETVRSFARIFGIDRSDNDPGLSIVVPWLSDEIGYSELIDAVVAGYFWPILNDQLSVEIRDGEQNIVIDAESLPALAVRLSREGGSMVALAAWAAALRPKDEIVLPLTEQDKPAWTAASVPPESLQTLRECLANAGRAGVRVPLWVRRRKEAAGGWHQARAMIYLEEARDASIRPTFARDGIIVTAVGATPLAGMRALVVIDDDNGQNPLAAMLGDAETPAHTQWQPGYLSKDFFYGRDTVAFVRGAAGELLARLRAEDTEDDSQWLAEFFPLPDETGENEPTPTPRARKKGEKPEDLPPIPPRKPQPIVIDRVKGGFALFPGDATIKLEPPPRFEVLVAYDVRDGNALSAWEPEDFQIGYPPLDLNPRPVGIRVLEKGGKRLVFEVQAQQFRLDMIGFDTKRDLYVKVNSLLSDDPQN